MGSLYRKLYVALTDASDEDIDSSSDVVKRQAPANFFRLLFARTASKAGDRLASPKTTLAWLLQALGAPAIFAGLVVPVRESGSLLPQVIFSNFLKRLKIRKWAWSAGAFLQGLAIAACALVAISLDGAAAGSAILLAVVFFSLARGISSVSAKDVLGKTIPKNKRGQLTGWAGSVSGVLTVVATSLFFFQGKEGSSISLYAAFLAGAAMLWFLAAAINLRVEEEESEVEESKGLFEGFNEQLKLLKDDEQFRNFLIVRTLAVGSGLSTPYVIALAHENLGGASMWLGVFIIAEGIAATVASPLWGKWADRSSRSVLRVAMGIVSALLAIVVIDSSTDILSGSAWIFYPLVFFLLGAAHSGVRVGRKTYIVDMAEGNQRTDYVAIANTLIGVLLLIAGLFAGLASLISIELALSLFASAALIGSLWGGRLSSVSKSQADKTHSQSLD